MYRIIFYFFCLLFFTSRLSSQEMNQEMASGGTRPDLESEFIEAMKFSVTEQQDEAIEKFKNLIPKMPKKGIPEFEISRIYYNLRKYDDALTFLNKAIVKDKSKREYIALYADIMEKQKNYEAAADSRLEILPNLRFDTKNYYDIADLYTQSKNKDKALITMQKLEDIVGKNINIDLYRVRTYFSFNDYKSAIEILKKLEIENPVNIDIKQKLAMAYKLNNDTVNAEKKYNEILSKEPQNVQALTYFSNNTKNNQNSVTTLKNILPMIKNSSVSLDDKILTLMPFVQKMSDDKDEKQLLLEIGKIISSDYPTSAKANALYADLLYNNGQIEKSTDFYKLSLQYDKTNFLIWKQLMTILTNGQKWKELEEITTSATQYYPNQSVNFYYSALAKSNLNKFEEAQEAIDEAISYSGKNLKFKNEALLIKAKIYLMENKLSKAEEIVKDLDENLNNDHPLFYELKGDIELNNGKKEKALEYWNKSVEKGNVSQSIMDKIQKSK